MKRVKNKRCVDCSFWSMWENICMHPNSKRLFEYVSGDTKACKLFKSEINSEGDKDGM